MTLAELSFLLSCFSRPDNPSVDLAAFKDVAAKWIEDGIIERDSSYGSTPAAGYIYRTTPRGDAWMKAILKTPFPKPAFLDAQGQPL